MTTININATIVLNAAAPSCEDDCGLDWSKKEQQIQAIKEVEERFGGKVQLEFIDISSAPEKAKQLLSAQGPKNEVLPFSTLFLNNAPRIVGSFDIRMLLDVIEAEQDRDL